MSEFAGKTVVVTGGAQGIGRGVVYAMREVDARVVAIDLDGEALEELPSDVRRVQADLGDPMQVERACAEIDGEVHLLVNNAGVSGEWKGLLDTSVEEWDRVLNLNLRAYWLMAKGIVPKMPPGASIVNIASTRAFMSEPNTEPYSASKGGVVALTHSLAISLAERRIRVNCVSPGWIEVAADQKASKRHDPELSERAHAQHPVGRVGRAGDIGAAVRFLASEGAEFITGTNLTVDGGMTVKMIYEE